MELISHYQDIFEILKSQPRRSYKNDSYTKKR